MHGYAAAEPHEPRYAYNTKMEVEILAVELDNELRHGQRVYAFKVQDLALTFSDVGAYTKVTARQGQKLAEFGYMLNGEDMQLAFACHSYTRGFKKLLIDPNKVSRPVIRNMLLSALVDTAVYQLNHTEATASVAESSEVLYQDEDIILNATASGSGISYEIGARSSYGARITSRIGNQGLAEILGSTMTLGSKAYEIVDTVSAFACVRKHVLDQVNAPLDTKAAAEPHQDPELTSSEIFLSYQNEFSAWARQNPGKVLFTHNHYQVHVDGSGEHEHDHGLVPLYITGNGVRLHAVDDVDPDRELPNPYLRFYMRNRQIFEFSVILPMLSHEIEVKVAVPVVPASKFKDVVEKVLAKAMPRLLDQRKKHTVATAAAASFTTKFARSIGTDGKKLVGKTVFGAEVLEVEILENSDVVSLRCRTSIGMLFLAATESGSVTLQAFTGARVRVLTVQPQSARLNAVVDALEYHEEPAPVQQAQPAEPEAEPETNVAEAAAEPGTYAISSTLAGLSNLKFETEHFRVALNKTQRPTVDDQENMYIQGEITPDEHARLFYGDKTFQYYLTITVNVKSRPSVSTVYLKLPQIYPNPEAPKLVPGGVALGDTTNSLAELARALVKALRPWLFQLDKKINEAEHPEVLLATVKHLDKFTSRCYTANLTTDVTKKSGAYPLYGRTLLIKLKNTVLYQILDNELQGPLGMFRIAFHACKAFIPGEGFELTAEAGPSAYDKRFVVDTKMHKAGVDKTNVETIFLTWLREYMHKLDLGITSST